MNKIKLFVSIVLMVFTGLNARAQYGYTLLHNFDFSSGSYPTNLLSDGDYFYGMTLDGGTYHDGTIFKVKHDGTGYTVLLNFNGANGAYPTGSLISDGTYLYGTTAAGGVRNKGVVFKIKPDGTGYTIMVCLPYYTGILYGSDTIDLPSVPVGTLATDGTYFYGVTAIGYGNTSTGSIFRIKSDSTGYSVMKTFDAVSGQYPQGANPLGGLIYNNGFLYGVTKSGGADNDGVIFKVSTLCSGLSCNTVTNLFQFNGTNGGGPTGPLVSDGTYLYGMAEYQYPDDIGTIFKIKFDGTGFTNIAQVDEPNGSLIYDNGYLYGVTKNQFSSDINGEEGNLGAVFKVKNDGTNFTYSHIFNEYDHSGYNGQNAGVYLNQLGFSINSIPSLISDGNYLYGTTNSGGNKDGDPGNGEYGGGVMFRLRKMPALIPFIGTTATMDIDGSIGIGEEMIQGDKLIASITPSGDYPISGSTTATVSIDNGVQVVNGIPYVQRHYDIEPAIDATTATAIVTLYFAQSEFDAYNQYITEHNLSLPLLPTGPDDEAGIDNISIFQYHGTGTAPGNYSGSTVQIHPLNENIFWKSDGGYWQISFEVSGFSGFYLRTTSAMPIHLLSFTGKIQNNIANLQWSSGEESNFDHFEIEKSTNGSSFQLQGIIPSKGSNNSYTFTTPQTEATAYYRLKMVDRDGGGKYSTVIRLSQNSGDNVVIYPNPATSSINIKVSKPRNIAIYDEVGRLVKTQTLHAGVNVVDVHRLDAGTYYGVTEGTKLKFVKR